MTQGKSLFGMVPSLALTFLGAGCVLCSCYRADQ